jgi:hypothetical protein
MVDLHFTLCLLVNYQLNNFVLMEIPKSKGVSCCAVAPYKYYSGKAKNTGRTDLSFHKHIINFF